MPQDNFAPKTLKSCPLPQYLLQKCLFPAKIANKSGTIKSIMPSHANKILKNPSEKYTIDQIHRYSYHFFFAIPAILCLPRRQSWCCRTAGTRQRLALITPAGHVFAHKRQPTHAASSTFAATPRQTLIAPRLHTFSHAPHATQFFSSTNAVFLCFMLSPKNVVELERFTLYTICLSLSNEKYFIQSSFSIKKGGSFRSRNKPPRIRGVYFFLLNARSKAENLLCRIVMRC